MRIHLNINPIVSPGSEIWQVVKFLEDRLDDPHIDHERMTMWGFFMGKRWRIDHCTTHWTVVVDKRHANKPWFVELKLRWT